MSDDSTGPKLPQWEYTWFHSEGADALNEMMRKANALGQEGWEMVNFGVDEQILKSVQAIVAESVRDCQRVLVQDGDEAGRIAFRGEVEPTVRRKSRRVTVTRAQGNAPAIPRVAAKRPAVRACARGNASDPTRWTRCPHRRSLR